LNSSLLILGGSTGYATAIEPVSPSRITPEKRRIWGEIDARIFCPRSSAQKELHFVTFEKNDALNFSQAYFYVARAVHRHDCMPHNLEAAEPDRRGFIHPRQAARAVIGSALIKIAKHMALVTSLLLIGKARSEPIIGPLGTFLVIIAAASIHSLGRWLQIAPASRNRFLRGGG
jgi:hypothetical protein